MTCWVAPSVAAEFWGVPLDQVVQAIEHGTLEARMDRDFLVVPIEAGGAAEIVPPPSTPATYTVIQREEHAEADAQEELDWREVRRRNEELRKGPIAA